ncbi:MAG: helix-turn-helix domain-containing protein [Candidatus Cloacimonetes bacterium]|nr:helix-turn-helix domain-containing protein [Candidatus Cloacimonadota bacterium]
MSDLPVAEKLTKLGLNRLEANIYSALLLHPGMTGYKVSQMLSRPIANTYKALQQLEDKGLVLCTEPTGTKSYIAVDIDEYVEKLKAVLNEEKEAFKKEMEGVKIPEKSFGNFVLRNHAQVHKRAMKMIEEAEDFVMIDAFPRSYNRLKDTIMKKREDSKVDVMAKVYNFGDNIDERIILHYDKDKKLEDWQGQWLTISKDGTEALMAVSTGDGKRLLHAIWTTDPVISYSVYTGMMNQFFCNEILTALVSPQLMLTKNIAKTTFSKYENIFGLSNKIGIEALDKMDGDIDID